MKKIVLALSILFLFSCKDKNGSSTSTSKSESSKTENTQQNQSLKKSDLPVSIKQDDKGLYHFKYNLEKGKTYPFNTKEIQIQTATSHGESHTIKEESIDNMDFTVIDIVNGKYIIRVNLKNKKVTTSADGKSATLDTNGAAPANPDQVKMWKVYKSLSGSSFTMELDSNGNVSNIKGMENVYNKIKTDLKKELSGKQLDDFIKIVKQGYNPELFKKQFEQVTVKFPDKGLKIGEEWVNDPKNKGKGYNKLTKVDDNYAEISLVGIIPPKEDSQKQGNVTYSVSVTGSQKGKIIIDNKTGWIHKANLDLIMTEKQSATDGKQTQEMTRKMENHSYIN